MRRLRERRPVRSLMDCGKRASRISRDLTGGIPRSFMSKATKRKFSTQDELASKLGKYWVAGQEENRREAAGRVLKKPRLLIDEVPQPKPRPRPRPRPRPQQTRASVPFVEAIVVEDNNLRNSAAVAPPWDLPLPIEPQARTELDAFVAASGTQDARILLRHFFSQVENVGVVFPAWKPGSMLKLSASAVATADEAQPGPLEGVATMGELLSAVGMAGLATQLDVTDLPIAFFKEKHAWFAEQAAFKNLDPAVQRAFVLALSWAARQ